MRSVFIDLKLSILGYEDSFEDSEDGVGERIMVVVFNDFLNRVSYSLNNLMIYFFKRVYGLQLIVLYDYIVYYENDLSVC